MARGDEMLADLTAGPFVGLWVVLWYSLFALFAVFSFLKRHWLWFILGFLLPIFWVVGALLPDRR
jgi:hypothetical protein